MEFFANTSKPPLPALFLLTAAKNKSITWGNETVLKFKGTSLKPDFVITRFLAASDKKNKWFGVNPIEEAEVNHWVSFSLGPLASPSDFDDAIAYLDTKLKPLTYFVSDHVTLADISVYSQLLSNGAWHDMVKNNKQPMNINRWFNMISHIDFVRNTIDILPKDVQIVSKKEAGRKEEGKFVDLPGAEMGKVIVRFPPEASGYLHIGHAKAALLNQYYKEAFNGKLIMRFDDTNPAKEKVDFEKVILEDLKLLKIPYDIFSHTSDHFDLLLELCEKLIKEGKAYVDDTDPEVMKNEREQKVASKNRSNTPQQNLKMWQEMIKGTQYGQKCCVRAKIDMNSLNGCMRDPTIYRCKNEPHPKTGTKYKVYPTYDFACPIVDSIEGVTHCLRTMEYHDRDEQFYWFIDALGLRKPYIWEYSRLNMVNTVLSKRKLTWIVDNNYVGGWDDPRMPTVRGILRRGMTVEGLKQFIISQGSSRSVVVMDWDKIWAINKKVIDPVAPRYTAVSQNNHVVVHISGVKEEPLSVAKHPKNPEVGQKTIWTGPEVIVDEADAELFKEGENVTFINWGNILIKEITKQNGKVTSVKAVPNLDDKNFKKTMKITWLAKIDTVRFIPCRTIYFDHIITKPILGKDEDFKDYINKNTRIFVDNYVDPELADLKEGDIIQLQRKGFFICEKPYYPLNERIGRDIPLALISIPDGHTKEMPTASAVLKTATKASTPTRTPEINSTQLSDQITAVGNKIRDMKASKASKDDIAKEVKQLLELKTAYKSATGQDWKPGDVKQEVPKSSSNDSSKLSDQITLQGNKVRDLKAAKASKDDIAKEVKQLLELKTAYKSATGQDWKPGDAKQEVPKSSSNDSSKLSDQITLQGNKVRDLKAAKASKDDIAKEVKQLLDLKTAYKSATGQDWKPGDAKQEVPKSSSNDSSKLSDQITLQGNKVRDLKAAKASKDDIAKEVKQLLDLKTAYKSATGQDWKPVDAKQEVPKSNSNDSSKLSDQITLQGNKVRDLKAAKASKDDVAKEVKQLLELKAAFKNATGQEWKPTEVKQETPKSASDSSKLSDQITAQGNRVRDLKAAKASKDDVAKEVKQLLELKAAFKNATGQEWKPTEVKQETPKSASDSSKLSDQITAQGNKVRDLKAAKASKDDVAKEVKQLLELKAAFKNATGQEWKPADVKQEAPKSSGDSNKLSDQITAQGNKVRDLKAAKASKDAIDKEVKVLLELKTAFKNATGQEWKPVEIKQNTGNAKITELTNEIKQQGDAVRALKSAKASKDNITDAVNKLLALKDEYKKLTGTDFPVEGRQSKPSIKTDSKQPPIQDNQVTELTNKIKEQGDAVRTLKGKNGSKDDINAAVNTLLSLKAEYKQLTGNDFPAEGRQNKPKPKDAPKAKPEPKKEADSALKKVTRLGLEAEKENNLPEWYSQVLVKGEMIEYYDVSGCYILRPWSFAIWESIKEWLDVEIKKLGVKNCYFPIFVSRNVLEKEKTHISDFAPEVAWVTKSGDSDLAEPIAVRPTSETVMYPAYAKWIQSYRDLPIKLNQWNNVVRWEFKHPQPFLRTREFLWQEGHTAFATFKEAEEEVYKILDLYEQVYTDLLAIPVVKGRKTEKEKFAGGDFTLTVEAYIGASGRSIQGATSHHLGQNFSKMFDIIYEDPETQEKKFVFQNSWGLTTRTIGVLIMIHADNQGLVLPPRVASLQIVIVPCGITVSLPEADKDKLIGACEKLKKNLITSGIRADTDVRDNYSPGWKFNHWELKGVPIRVEIGPKDLQKGEIVAVRRDTGEKSSIKDQNAVSSLQTLLTSIQSNLLKKATDELNTHMVVCKDWKSFCQHLDNKNIIQAPFCGEIECEDNIKNDSARNEDVDTNAPSMGAKSLCIPFKPLVQHTPGNKCIHPKCNKESKFFTLFGRSY